MEDIALQLPDVGTEVPTLDLETEAVLAGVEMAPLTPTLADLMREGAKDVPQKFGSWGDQSEACALMTALLAARKRGLA